MLVTQVGMLILYGIGLGSLSALVYMAGPFIAFGDFRPLENPIVRDIVILLLTAAVAAVAGWKIWKRRQGAAKVAATMSGEGAAESDADVLKERMKDALATLKTAAGGRANYLYDLPWYVIIGAPGSGKTTALVNSGLKFPLARGTRPEAVAGIGGTRYCDWWFTEDAVLIDTAGRYTTQDSDAKSDQKSWFAFLDTLKKGRPKQPINGVLVCISVEDLLTLGRAELAAHAEAIRARLLELHTRLKVDFPVYVLFTKTDLLLGFTEYFQGFGENARRQVFGATFKTTDKGRNLVGLVPEEFDALVSRLTEDMADHLQDEPDPVARVQAFGFPSQLQALKRPLYDMLGSIFEPTRYHARATLRGFYFTSGTQQGMPIDQLIGALEKSFGAIELPAAAFSGTGRSYFLTDLIRKVIIGEAAWVSTDRAAVRRAAIIKASLLTLILGTAVGLSSLWWISYSRNRDVIAATVAEVDAYRAAAGDPARTAVVGDRDLLQPAALLNRLRFLPLGYAARDNPIPLLETFGLSQHERLRAAAITAYRNGLERLLRPRLIYRLEEVLDQKRDDPSVLYGALKVYLMLGGQHKIDRALVLDWMRRDWADLLYPGEGYASLRKSLDDHLQALVDLDTGEPPLFTLNGPLLADSQNRLARLSITQRAYELLKAKAATSPNRQDWFLTRQGGLQAAALFDPAPGQDIAAIKVPYFYTYAGFHHDFLNRLNAVAKEVESEKWVLGDTAEQPAFAEQYRALPQALLDLYSNDYIATWQAMLGQIRLKRLSGPGGYVPLTYAASTGASPLKALILAVWNETALTRERPDAAPLRPAAPGAAGSAEAAPVPAPPELPPQLQGASPGAAVETAFKAYGDMVTGDPGNQPIDGVLRTLGGIASNLNRARASPADRAQINSEMQRQVADLRSIATTLPVPFGGMLQRSAAEFDNEAVAASLGVLSQSIGEVAQQCRALVEDRYPLVRGGDREVGLSDFAKVFGPGGLIDNYFKANLDKYVDRSRREWAGLANDPVGRSLSLANLRMFQRAAEIRDAFFPSGGQPGFMVTVAPPTLTDPNVSTRVDFYGTPIVSKLGDDGPTAAPWPGSGAFQLKITLTTQSSGAVAVPDSNAAKPADAAAQGGTAQPAQPAQPTPPPPPETATLINKTGVWALFRLLDEAGRGGTKVQFFSGGKTYAFQFSVAATSNPLNLSLLRQFRCPTGI